MRLVDVWYYVRDQIGVACALAVTAGIFIVVHSVIKILWAPVLS